MRKPLWTGDIAKFVQDVRELWGRPITDVIGKTASFVLQNDGMYFCDDTSGNITVSLPDASTVPGRIAWFKKVNDSTNTVTIDAYASQTIDGSLTQVLYDQWDVIGIISDGYTEWKKLCGEGVGLYGPI